MTKKQIMNLTTRDIANVTTTKPITTKQLVAAVVGEQVKSNDTRYQAVYKLLTEASEEGLVERADHEGRGAAWIVTSDGASVEPDSEISAILDNVDTSDVDEALDEAKSKDEEKSETKSSSKSYRYKDRPRCSWKPRLGEGSEYHLPLDEEGFLLTASGSRRQHNGEDIHVEAVYFRCPECGKLIGGHRLKWLKRTQQYKMYPHFEVISPVDEDPELTLYWTDDGWELRRNGGEEAYSWHGVRPGEAEPSGDSVPTDEVEVAPSEQPLDDMTKAELRELLKDEFGVKMPKSAKKSSILAMIVRKREGEAEAAA